MRVTLQEALIPATIGALVGGLCSLSITSWQLRTAHRNALELIKRQEFIKVSHLFHNAFMDILIFCGEETTGIGGEKRITDVLAESIGEHKKAMLLFRAYLPDSQWLTFDKTWNEYSRQDKWRELNVNSISAEYGAVFDTEKEREKRHLAALRINKLLEFAPLN